MPEPEFTTDLIGHTVLDGESKRLGPLTALYADADSHALTFAAVTMIRRGRRRSVFVPLRGALVSGSSITLRCGAQLVRRAPSVQAGRPLPAEAESDLFAHYEMPYAPAAAGQRRLLAVHG
ncbi:MAG TPA: hypothetical protein VKB75_10010 [Jatrophihabitans sp.]|nr:hypothetical protein [Jatrophihabitans sp.]